MTHEYDCPGRTTDWPGGAPPAQAGLTPEKLASEMAFAYHAADSDSGLLSYASAFLAMRETLESLYAVQNGSPLPKYYELWANAMASTREVLTKVDALLEGAIGGHI